MSKIEWTDKTWNPVTGCTKVSQGCKNCYAERMYERFNGKGSFKNIICHEDRLNHPFRWKKPAMVFVNSMSDLFHEDVPFEFIDRVLGVTRRTGINGHTYQILTKRPDRMVEYFKREDTEPLMPHVWLGVSVEDQETANERIPLLLQVPAAVRFLSCEPLLGPIDFYLTSASMPSDISHPWRGEPILHGIHWLIAGGESGPGARPMHPDWIRELREQCVEGGVAFFFKQWGEWVEHRLSDAKELKSVFHKGFGQDMCRVGKKAAGRLLDGQLHNEFPKTA